MANKLKINEEKYITMVEPSLKEARCVKEIILKLINLF